jgi:hypothetical protein
MKLENQITNIALSCKNEWDELFYNKHTGIKPSDLSEEWRLKAVVCLLSNHYSWDETYPKGVRQECCDIYYKITDFFYKDDSEVNREDITKFYRLID